MSTRNLEQFANLLRSTRKGKRLSQAELAEKVGLTQAHISRIEQGEVDLKLSSLIELARALDLELEFVPRGAIPALQELIRHSPPSPAVVAALRDLQQTAKRARRATNDSDIRNLPVLATELQALPSLPGSSRTILAASTALRRWLSSKNDEDMSALKDAVRSLQRLRNMVVHGVTSEGVPAQVPAYRLGDDDNG
jgi:transcriptional regulator with XRE-family HTH domain